MKQTILALLMSAVVLSTGAQTPVITQTVPAVSEIWKPGYFPISDAVIYTDAKDYKVVGITAHMLADDVERVTGRRPQVNYRCIGHQRQMGVVCNHYNKTPQTRWATAGNSRQRPSRNSIRPDVTQRGYRCVALVLVGRRHPPT